MPRTSEIVVLHIPKRDKERGRELLAAAERKLESDPNHQDYLDIATGQLPLVPFHNPLGDNRQNFELATLLQHVLHFGKHFNPITRERLLPENLGSLYRLNRNLLWKIGQLLEEEGSSMDELLECFGVSKELHLFLQEYKYDPNLRAESFSCIQKYGIKISLFLLFYGLYFAVLSDYRLSIGNPETAENLSKIVSNSFKKLVGNSTGWVYEFPNFNSEVGIQEHSITFSSICEVLQGKSWPSLPPFEGFMQRCEDNFAIASSSTAVLSNGDGRHPLYPDLTFELSFDYLKVRTPTTMITFGELLGASALLYSTYKIYDHFRGESSWRQLLRDKKFFACMVVNVGIVVLGIDAYFDLLGLVSYLQQTRGAAADVCYSLIQACNKGMRITHKVADQELVYRLSDDDLVVPKIPIRDTAAIVNIVVPPVAILYAGIHGFFKRPAPNESKEKGKREFLELKENSRYDYLNQAPPKKTRSCLRCVIM